MIPSLKIGDQIAVTAPASRVNPDDLSEGIQILESWGLSVKVGNTIGNSYYNFSASLDERLSELQSFLDDSSIRCIIAARGGYGISDLIDKLDFSQFGKYPKWMVGFSDITALILHLNSIGYPGIHGPMVKTMNWDESSQEYLRKILFGESLTTYHWEASKFNREGRAEGVAVGGNLSLLAHSIGSQSDFDFDGKILFLEDIGEKVYSLDRMMVQLKRAGKLKKLAGLVIGDFSDSEENSTPFGKNEIEIILDHTSGFDYPIAFDFKFGHEKENWPVVMGAEYQLSTDKNIAELKQINNVTV